MEFNDVVIVLTTRRSLEQVHYKGDVVLSVYGDEILVLHSGAMPVLRGNRTRRLDPLPDLFMEHITRFNGVTILLTTQGWLEYVGYSGECDVVLSVHKDEVRVLASDPKVVLAT